jgi:ArsR family transcriptional regulator
MRRTSATRKSPPKADPIVDLERLFQALGDATRLRILGLLLTGEVCVCDIHESLNLPQPKVSRHLAYLRKAGLVETRREGLWVHYRLGHAPDPVLGVVREAVTHALMHVHTVQRDAKRLEKKNGCCLPDVPCLPTCGCCVPVAPMQIQKGTRVDHAS